MSDCQLAQQGPVERQVVASRWLKVTAGLPSCRREQDAKKVSFSVGLQQRALSHLQVTRCALKLQPECNLSTVPRYKGRGKEVERNQATVVARFLKRLLDKL
jgi:hypothetical protein